MSICGIILPRLVQPAGAPQAVSAEHDYLADSGKGRMRNMDELVFLKLGGSLITEKANRYTARLDKLRSLAAEIRDALDEVKGLRLVVGHGSGSFGHYAVQDHLDPANFPPSQLGRPRSETAYWTGFAEVWTARSHSSTVPDLHFAVLCRVTRDGSDQSGTLHRSRQRCQRGDAADIWGYRIWRQTGWQCLHRALIWHLAT
jgi:hypothetical protein